jgi:hypothetical protein
VLYPALDKHSPYAAYIPLPASIRNPVAIGTEPETGGMFPLAAWDETDGGKQIAVLGAPGAGKSTLYAAVSAGATACPDAALLQINLAKPQTDDVWAPAAAATATTDPDSAIAILAFASCVIALRSDPRRGTSHPDYDLHLPTATEPAYFLKIDEGRSLAVVPGAPALVEHIMQAGRSEAVSTMLALHRSVATYFGNANIRALTRTVVAGQIPAPEIRRLLDEDAVIPDMRGYGEGQGGVFLIASRFGGQQARGRTFFMTKDLRNWRTIAQAHAAVRGPFALDPYLAPLAPGWEALQAGDYRKAIAQFCGAVPLLPTLLANTKFENLAPTGRRSAPQPQHGDPRRAKITAALATLGDTAQPGPVSQKPVSVPSAPPVATMGQRLADLPTRQLQDKLRAMLARPEGVTSRPASDVLGVSHTAVQHQLRKWRAEGTAQWDTQSNTWREARPGTHSVPYLRPVPDAPDDAAGAPAASSGSVPGAGQDAVPAASGTTPRSASVPAPSAPVPEPARAPGAPGTVPGPAPKEAALTGEPVPADRFTPQEMALIAASWMLLHGPEHGLAVARRGSVPEEVIAQAVELLDTDRPHVESELRRWRDAVGGAPR